MGAQYYARSGDAASKQAAERDVVARAVDRHTQAPFMWTTRRVPPRSVKDM